MKKLSAPVIKRLRLEDAVIAEAASRRRLLPDEPNWDRIEDHAGDIAKYLANQLQAGFHPVPQVELAARKPAHGVRPVPYWGILERIAYRALTTAALKGMDPPDRTPQAYLEFVTAPGRYARDRQSESSSAVSNFLFLSDTPVKYVVKSDLTAFYQFIDHSVLAEELLLRGVDFELISALMELLAEVQGHNYGLPQLFDASDWLSDLYADRIERDLLRSGFIVWRFNDDFRIACDTYADALRAIEALDAAARRVGLVLSENKTVTVGITKYIFDTFGLAASGATEEVNVDNVEDILGDYTDDFGEEHADDAFALIQAAQVSVIDDTELSDRRQINLNNISGEDVRILRRAINGLAVATDTRAINDVVRLAIYAPSLTPNLMQYLRRVGKQLNPEDDAWNNLVTTVDRLANEVSLNAWQYLWLVDVVHDLGLLSAQLADKEGVLRRAKWVDDLRKDNSNEALRAVATRALASQGHVQVTSVIDAADRASDALLHIYASAGTECVDKLVGTDKKDAQRAIDAWAKTSKLHAFLLRA